jgi:hypothetical protein
VAAKRIFGPFTREQVSKWYSFFRTNPFGAVVNGDGSTRAINSLSFPKHREGVPLVNSFVEKVDYKTTWDKFNHVSKFFRALKKPVQLAIFDWEKAYIQIPTAKEQWPYLMIQDFAGGLYVDTRIAFGGVAGCGSFGRPADAWKDIMKAEFDLIKVSRWVDNNLFVKDPDVELSMDKTNKLGVKTNNGKYHPFQEEQKYIGFVWNGSNRTVRLPEGRVELRILQIAPFLEAGHKSLYEDV